jgi:predicted RNA binding protein YcfA (HicA-like mRNA interferase family)
MTRNPAISGKQVREALKRHGFWVVRSNGSHFFLLREGLKSPVCVPVHGTEALKPATLRSILRQLGMSLEELRRWL